MRFTRTFCSTNASVGVAHNIATAIFGGMAEFAALFAKQRGHETWFYWYVSSVCFAAFLTEFLIGDAQIESPDARQAIRE